MNSKINFYIVRHGQTILNVLQRVQGWCDSPLTEKGREVAQYLGMGLKGVHFDSAYCSDLRRTFETINLVLKYSGNNIEPLECSEFREVSFGRYEGNFNHEMWKDASLYLQYKTVEDLFKDVFDVNKEDVTYEHVANTIKKLDTLNVAENFNNVKTRMYKKLLQIAEKEIEYKEERNVVIVSHGMSINFLLQKLGGKSLLKKDLENASVSKVIYEDGKFYIESVNDMNYVENGKKG